VVNLSESEQDPDTAKKTKTAKNAKKLGSSKAVDTMFRSVYRAELDLISLAAMKANIMISINGLIISALVISGALFFTPSAGIIITAIIFLITAATSIIFALLAASPEDLDLFATLRKWLGAVRRGEAGPGDLKRFILHSRHASEDDELNMLVFSDLAGLSRDEYREHMVNMLEDRNDVYNKMTDQLYWLGQMANRKFKLLDVSYTVFRWGLLVTVLSFVVTSLAPALIPGLGDDEVALQNLGISEFDDIFEPSAVQQIPDGRLLVVEDEANRAVSIVSFDADGTLRENRSLDLQLMRSFDGELIDLEGLSIDSAGSIYAITSHSTNNDGKRREDREQLLRFNVDGDRIQNVRSYRNLRDDLTSSPDLIDAVRSISAEDVDFTSLNIEGLAYDPASDHLLLGLRSPIPAGQSMIVAIENPSDVVEEKSVPQFAPPTFLNLDGGGIRALSFDPVLDAFIIVNEVETASGDDVSQLWSWNGEPDGVASRLTLPGIINLNNVESIDSVELRGERRLILMSDEGVEGERPAKYLVLDYDQIRSGASS